MRFVKLSEEENQRLNKLHKSSPNSVVRNRSLSLLYSNENRSIKEVSELVSVSRRSLEHFFNSWESATNKYETLFISAGRGAKVKLDPVRNLLPDLVQEHSRNLNSILEELQSKHSISVCKPTLQNFLKSFGM